MFECPSLGRTCLLDLMTPKHGFLFESYDFQAVLFFDPYELCGVEWLTSSVGMDIPNISRRRGGFPTCAVRLFVYFFAGQASLCDGA